MFSIFTSIVIWALLGSLIGWWLGPFTGLALFCGGLLMLIFISTLQLSRVERWTRNLSDPLRPPLAPGTPFWPPSIASCAVTGRKFRS